MLSENCMIVDRMGKSGHSVQKMCYLLPAMCRSALLYELSHQLQQQARSSTFMKLTRLHISHCWFVVITLL